MTLLIEYVTLYICFNQWKVGKLMFRRCVLWFRGVYLLLQRTCGTKLNSIDPRQNNALFTHVWMRPIYEKLTIYSINCVWWCVVRVFAAASQQRKWNPCVLIIYIIRFIRFSMRTQLEGVGPVSWIVALCWWHCDFILIRVQFIYICKRNKYLYFTMLLFCLFCFLLLLLLRSAKLIGVCVYKRNVLIHNVLCILASHICAGFPHDVVDNDGGGQYSNDIPRPITSNSIYIHTHNTHVSRMISHRGETKCARIRKRAARQHTTHSYRMCESLLYTAY